MEIFHQSKETLDLDLTYAYHFRALNAGCIFPALDLGYILEWYFFFLLDQNIHGTFTHTWTRPCQNTRLTPTLMVG